MAKQFNVTGACRPAKHYMVDLQPRLEQIKAMVDAGNYFVINRARQYGKTTTMRALAVYLQKDYQVVSLDFQRLSSKSFESEQAFLGALSYELVRCAGELPAEAREGLLAFAEGTARRSSMQALFDVLALWCGQSPQPVVLMIDEVDTASNNQVFLDFLAQLRTAYLDSDVTPTFQSVILAGVHDVRSIKRKIRPDEAHKINSPWNIAAKFDIDMSLSREGIAGMLAEYEADFRTGMDIGLIAGLLCDYTSGYPYLVSSLCKMMDEDLPGTARFPDKGSAWTKDGLLTAVKMILEENSPLFDSLMEKLERYPELDGVISKLLFQGHPIVFSPDNDAVRTAQMFGFVKVLNGRVLIANRIFETRLYNRFLFTCREQTTAIYAEGAGGKNQFIAGGRLNMRLVLERFVHIFDSLYGGRDDAFLEEEGRRYFMLFLLPIINGEGNCYVEPETRDRERMDLVIDYHGEQSVCELKIWRGNAYNERGEEQLAGYLDAFHLKKGYMLSFCFNKKKEIGVKEILLGDRLLIEAVV